MCAPAKPVKYYAITRNDGEQQCDEYELSSSITLIRAAGFSSSRSSSRLVVISDYDILRSYFFFVLPLARTTRLTAKPCGRERRGRDAGRLPRFIGELTRKGFNISRYLFSRHDIDANTLARVSLCHLTTAT